MARTNRQDEPGSILHIYNRGLAKRTVFENRSDVRYFLSRIAREYRRRRLLVHAYVVLTNHFHLLVESPLGRVSDALRVIQNEYVRRFNRLRKRDGPLFRGRFGSRRVRSDSYWWTLLRYIDLHSVRSRLATSEGVYPFGSAYHYLHPDGPRWLTRGRVEGMLSEEAPGTRYEPALYERLLTRPLTRAEQELVELRMSGSRENSDPLDEVLTAGPDGVRNWMVDKAERADGTRPGIAVVSPSHLEAELAARRELSPGWKVAPKRQRRDAWDLMLTGLLRETCALSYREIALRLGVALSCAESRWNAHRQLLQGDQDYAARAATLIDACLEPFRAQLP